MNNDEWFGLGFCLAIITAAVFSIVCPAQAAMHKTNCQPNVEHCRSISE